MYVLELAGQDDQFAAAEAGNAATGITVIASGVALAKDIDQRRATGLAFTHRVDTFIGKTTANIDRAIELLESIDIDLTGSAAVRARDVRGTTGLSTQRAERELGNILAARGFDIDLETPDHELRILFAGDTCVIGWLLAETIREYGDRAPTDKPFFQPGSMDPLEARAVANLAGAGPGLTVADPMCGTGGILVEAGLLGAHPIGIDVQLKMVTGARENLTHYLSERGDVIHGDATRLPLCGGVDSVIFDTPYGRQSKIAGHDQRTLLLEVLTEIRSITHTAVVVSDHRVTDAIDATNWVIDEVFERPVHRSLTRFVHVLTTTAR